MADVVRYIVLAEGLILIGFAVLVLQEANKFRAPPAHIILISMSYILLIVWGMVGVWTSLGQRPTWRGPLSVIALSFGLAAMYSMYKAYNSESREARHRAAAEEAAKQLLEQTAAAEKAKQEESDS